MIIRSACLAGAIAVLTAAPALARDVFECKFQDVASNMGYLPLIVVVAHDTGSDTATVVDPFIQTLKGAPIDAKVAADTETKLSVSWTILLQSRANEYVNMAYRVSIQKGSLAASLAGKPPAFANTFTAQGKCKRLKA